MCNFLVLRSSRVESRVASPESQRKFELIPSLTLAAGVIAAVVVASAPVYAQLDTQITSPGQEAGAPVQRLQTRPVVRRAQQQAQTKAAVQRGETEPAVRPGRAKPTVQRAQTRAIVQRAQAKPTAQRAHAGATAVRTVGTRTTTAGMQTKADITKTAMPLPAPDLLAPLPEPDCTFDTTRATADDRQKLDYERQCYRHAEIIIRARFERLQDEVGKMIKAGKSPARQHDLTARAILS